MASETFEFQDTNILDRSPGHRKRVTQPIHISVLQRDKNVPLLEMVMQQSHELFQPYRQNPGLEGPIRPSQASDDLTGRWAEAGMPFRYDRAEAPLLN